MILERPRNGSASAAHRAKVTLRKLRRPASRFATATISATGSVQVTAVEGPHNLGDPERRLPHACCDIQRGLSRPADPVSRAQPDAGEPRGSPVERLNPEAQQVNDFILFQEKR